MVIVVIVIIKQIQFLFGKIKESNKVMQIMLIIKEKLEMYKKEVEYIRIIKILILLDLGNLIFDIVNSKYVFFICL